MLVCWSVKGGVGTTVVSCAVALLLAADVSLDDAVLLIDLGGDVSAALGMPAEPPLPLAGSLLGPVVAVSTTLGIARADWATAGLDPTATVDSWARSASVVIVDAGRIDPDDARAAALLGRADPSLLVIRPCFMGLRRAAASPLRPSGIVLIDERERSITPDDVGAVSARVPRVLQRSLAGIVACV
jgi:hypothetical protein